MPSEKSLYRKIQLVLEVAQSTTASTLSDLDREIEARKLPNFNTLQYDSQKEEFRLRQSKKVIRRTVRFCNGLGLLEGDGSLTRVGRQATRETQFDRLLAETIRGILNRSGVTAARLNTLIKQGLQSDPPILPTAKQLRAAAGDDMRLSEFSRFLTLLSHCGVAQSSQAKVYLRFDSR